MPRDAAGAALHPGFTLLELLVVVVILAGASALVVGGLARGIAGGPARQRECLGNLLNALNLARLDAMRRQSPLTVRLSAEDDDLLLWSKAGERRWKGARLQPIAPAQVTAPAGGVIRYEHEIADASDTPMTAANLTAQFDTAGRTRERAWCVGEKQGGPGPIRTLWVIRFDPLSGLPTLAKAGMTRGQPGSEPRE